MPKVILFDADGVTVLAPEPFSRVYARQHHRDPEELEPFYAAAFQDALLGRRDILDVLEQERALWQGEPQELIEQWCKAEDFPNRELIAVIKDLKAGGLLCALATNQEARRLHYVKEHMFPGVFDKVFASCDIGHLKPSPEFFKAVIATLQPHIANPSEIVYFDDSERNVMAATALGMRAYVYQSPQQVKAICRAG